MSSVAEIRKYLLLLGWSEKQLQSQRPWNDFEKLEKLANEKGGTLRDTAAVHAALAAELAKAAAAARQEREAKFRPLSEKEERRMRLAFDHFDEDASGELDRAEFRRAMMDCGMMPLGLKSSRSSVRPTRTARAWSTTTSIRGSYSCTSRSKTAAPSSPRR